MKYKILLLLVILLVSVSASFAVLETDIDDSQNDVDAIAEGDAPRQHIKYRTSLTHGEKGKIMVEQIDWYSRNYEKLGISDYLKDNPYFDGANVDLPEDPFPHKDTDYRMIAYSKNPQSYIDFESLPMFLDPAFQKAIANNGVFDDGSILMGCGITLNAHGDNSNNSNLSTYSLELADDSNSSVVENTNTTNNTPVVSAGMESTGLPIATLILAALVSIVAFRRKE